MKLIIHPTVILRTPKFSYLANLEASWNELKAAIAISSDAFYQIIKDVEADQISSLPPKVFFTVWKYFNRARYRSTPYGTFASFSIMEQGIQPVANPIRIEKNEQLRTLIDWPFKNNLPLQLANLIPNNCLLFSNSSYYIVQNSIRYITCNDGTFELSELDYDDFVKRVLDTCATPIRIQDLTKALGLESSEEEGFFSLLQDMHDLQLIFTNYDPNIIGEDYFERLNVKAENPPQYIIAQRKVKSGNIAERSLAAIPGLVNLLQAILPAAERDALSKFIQRFKKKFEGQEIALIEALDPEMGVGYDELEQAENSDDFILQVNSKSKNRDNELDQLKTVLKNNLNLNQFADHETILLNKLDLQINETPKTIPNTISMVMSVSDELIFANQIGGVTANALTGRFTMVGEQVENYAKEIANIEKNANPDILFFDVAYMVETSIDNVNRRKLIYDAQLAILNFDTSSSPLTLNDLQISVVGSEIILRSKKLNKRLVPRMASAYNYTRSDLSVFRLLCDVQHHGLNSSLSLSLDNLFPDLDYYPRLQYQNIVISPKKWKIKKDDLFDQRKKLITVESCKAQLTKIGVSKFFKTGLSDQTLCFSLEEKTDMEAFVQYMQKQTSIYVEEVNLPDLPAVTDEAKSPYLEQFILSIYHDQNIYRPATSSKEMSVKRIFPPGSEWLYFEISCHQQRSDELLVACINPFLANNEADIKKWFFIKYDENGNHIRLRILLKDVARGQAITSNLLIYLDEYLSSGLVSDIQLKTYKRELERYGANLIEQTESHFDIDSRWVIAVLEAQADDWTKYKLCIDVALKVDESGVLGSYEFVKVVRKISDAFNREHDLGTAEFKKLNVQYQQFFIAANNTDNYLEMATYNEFVSSFIGLLENCDESQRVKTFGDLMHMHVNRLFNKNQRSHEMIMYYFLLKSLQRKMSIG